MRCPLLFWSRHHGAYAYSRFPQPSNSVATAVGNPALGRMCMRLANVRVRVSTSNSDQTASEHASLDSTVTYIAVWDRYPRAKYRSRLVQLLSPRGTAGRGALHARRVRVWVCIYRYRDILIGRLSAYFHRYVRCSFHMRNVGSSGIGKSATKLPL
jgi:hypothetical protein